MAPAPGDEREKLIKIVTIVVLAVWVVTVLIQVFDSTRQVPNTVNVIMGMVVTGLTGAQLVTRWRDGNGNGNGNGRS